MAWGWGGGVSHYSADTMAVVFRPEGDGRYVRAIHLDRRGRLWVATAEGLDVREDGVWRPVARPSDPEDRLLALGEDSSGNMWAGTWPGGGVAVLGEDQLKKVYTEADGLASDHVLCVLGDANGDVWLGTAAGLSHFHDGIFTNYTQANGLPHPRVRALARAGDT